MLNRQEALIEALRTNIKAMRDDVTEEGGVDKIIDAIGEYIMIRLAKAIVKNYKYVWRELGLALSVGAQFVRNAARGAIGGAEDANAAAGQTTGAATTPVPIPNPGHRAEPTESAGGVTVNNYVRSNMDARMVEDVVRTTVAEEFR